MKKRFVTTIDESAALYETIFFSGGKIGCQIETSLDALKSRFTGRRGRSNRLANSKKTYEQLFIYLLNLSLFALY